MSDPSVDITEFLIIYLILPPLEAVKVGARYPLTDRISDHDAELMFPFEVHES